MRTPGRGWARTSGAALAALLLSACAAAGRALESPGTAIVSPANTLSEKRSMCLALVELAGCDAVLPHGGAEAANRRHSSPASVLRVRTVCRAACAGWRPQGEVRTARRRAAFLL